MNVWVKLVDTLFYRGWNLQNFKNIKNKPEPEISKRMIILSNENLKKYVFDLTVSNHCFPSTCVAESVDTLLIWRSGIQASPFVLFP